MKEFVVRITITLLILGGLFFVLMDDQAWASLGDILNALAK